LFREPALAGLLEELKSPAEAGSREIRIPFNHQLKLVANKKTRRMALHFMGNHAA
jgi:hypothetical protein